MNDDLTILSIEEVCQVLKIGRNRIYHLLNNGLIKGYREGNRWKISRKAVEEYISTQSNMRTNSNKNSNKVSD